MTRRDRRKRVLDAHGWHAVHYALGQLLGFGTDDLVAFLTDEQTDALCRRVLGNNRRTIHAGFAALRAELERAS